MFSKTINISDRVANQLPEFIRNEDEQLVNFLIEYYKSQEKTGRPYNVLNNIIKYLDIDEYDTATLNSSTSLIKDVGVYDEVIEVEQIDGFLESKGSIMIDNEIIYYDETVRGPDAILTPGISLEEFNKKRQALESPWELFDGTRTTFPLKFLGTPVSAVSAEHLAVTIYGDLLIPQIDYTISGSEITFLNPPRARTGNDQVELTQVLYYIGFADAVIKELTLPAVEDLAGQDSMVMSYDALPYSPIAEIGLIINRNAVLQRPYVDYVLTDNNTRIKFFVNISNQDTFHIRSIEYVSPTVGQGASAVTRVGSNGEIDKIIVKDGGKGYELNFAPKLSIYSSTGVGEAAAGKTLVNGIKDSQLIRGGQGYTSYNPPVVLITPPSDLQNGSQATAEITVDDETGTVSGIEITNSGSGYDFIPAITFLNPDGAVISDPEIDSEGRLIGGSITVTAGGIGYSNAPTIYIDDAPDDGINAAATCNVSPNGQIISVTITNRGRGYTTPPRARIVQPVGAQVLDVTVANGNVTNINLLTGGAGYTDAPSVYIVDPRKGPLGEAIGGTGAKAAATIFNGEITDINIISFGTGYSDTEPPKVYIASPAAAQASCDVGFGEVTGFTILSSGRNYEPSALIGCARGVSDIAAFDDYSNQIFAKEDQLRQSSHSEESVVRNLDSMIIKQVFDKFRRQYMPTINLDYSQVNPILVIKKIKDFYVSKGTKKATQYLFKILFGEEVDVYYPRDEMITPSAASWVVDTILRAELVSGNPADLIDSQLVQIADPVDQNIKDASVLIENVISIIEGTDIIYELAISEETLSGIFKIPYKTVLVEPLDTTEGIITVDSTIGWPEKNGTIIIDDNEIVQYKDKSLNQFIECTRSKNGVVEDWDPGTIIHSDIFVYTNPGQSNEVKLRILGIAEAGTTVLEDSGSYYLPGDKLNVAALGSTDQDERLQSWLYNVKKLIKVSGIIPGGLNRTATVTCENPHGLLVEDSVTIYGANPAVYNGTFEVTARLDEFTFSYLIPVPTSIEPQGNILLSVDLNRGKSTVNTINEVISLFTSNIQNTFFNNDYVYVAASGLPNYKIGPFTGSALIPGNQRKLLRFPRIVNTVSTRTTVQPNTPIGAWINGVSAWGYKDQEFVTFGPITSIDITNSGEQYDAGSIPTLEITGGGGTGASASVVVNGSLNSVDVTNQGSGYTDQPLISIVGGGGQGATAQAVVTNGRVTRVLVGNPGTGYTSQPTISITGGGGTGALAVAQVRGAISAVNILSRGTGYTSKPDIRLNSGEGALAQPIVINGRLVSIAIINSGSGYTTAPTVYINGDGFGAKGTAVIGTLGEDKGKVISVTIDNRGVGYTQGNTTVRMEAVGQLATFNANVFEWNKNLEYDLNSKYDIARGYVFTGFNNQYGGEYAHVSDPKELRYVVGDNVILDPETNTFKEEGTDTGAAITHSPIIGWAFDGNPIYGPYGYIDPTDQNAGIRRLRSSYSLKSNVVYDVDTNPVPARIDGPSLTTYPAGQFVDDYEYSFQEGDLDPYNGRFCKTPDYPNGIYCYFITIDASELGLPVFPYIIGPQFNSIVDTWNLSQTASQENIPEGVSRFRDPYEEVDIDIERQPNQQSDQLVTEREGDLILFETEDIDNDGIISPAEIATDQVMTEEAALQIYDYFPRVSTESRVDIEVETTTKFENAQIDGFVIENSGVSYQVNDTLFFDNTGTDGFGASAQVESVQGAGIASYRKEVINDIPYGKITTSTDHELIAQDEVIVSSRVITENTNKRFYMSVVTGIDSISVTQSGIGYNQAIPPTYEIITSQGQDVELDIKLDLTTGKVGAVDIINSGFNYDVDNSPVIRVSHPQRAKKTYYWSTLFTENANAKFEIFDSVVSSNRDLYICGQITEAGGNSSAFVAKFNDLGNVVWDRSLLPSATIKVSRWKKMYLDETSEENDLIYLIGETESQSTVNYNPDILVAKYESGFDNANNPEGIVRWQKEIAGVSGSTRRDYAGDIYLDDEQRVYICGWTDTNSPDPDDIWVIQLNSFGDLIEKRKFASDSEGEQMNQLYYIGNNKMVFAGIDKDNNDLIFGEMEYDGANIELTYVKRLAVTGGNVQNPQFIIDEYNDVFFVCDMWNGTKNYGVAFFKIAMAQLKLVASAPTWQFAKIMAPTVSFESVKHAGITVDVFGNVNVVTEIKYSDNNLTANLCSFKYDGTLLNQSDIWKTASEIGFTTHTHAVDNSGDIILSTNKQNPDQVIIHRFENAAALTEDATKQDIPTISLLNAGNAAHDTTDFKFGSGSLDFTGLNRLLWEDLNITTDWTVGMWVQMDSSWDSSDARINMITALADTGGDVQFVVQGDSSDANYGKIALELNPQGGTQVTVWSVGSTYWATLSDNAWHHIAFVKEEPSLGSYVYSCYFDGVIVATTTTVESIVLDDLYVGADRTSPTTANGFVGNFDDIVVDPTAVYTTASFTLPTEQFRITSKNSGLELIKFDRLHSKRGTYTPTSATRSGENLRIEDIDSGTAGININTLSNPVITTWLVGSSGLQILDYADVTSTLAPGTYNFASDRFTYSTKTSTIPTPLGRKLILDPIVLPKYYVRDAGYQKIDAVKEFTFNQNIKLEKGSILQQVNSIGVVQAYGTIVETPVGSIDDPGLGNIYKVGKIFGTFNNDDLYQNDLGEENTIDEISFEVTRPQSAWETGKVYAVNDQVWSDNKIYYATNNSTSGVTPPTHTIGAVTDGAVTWQFISTAPNIEVNLLDYPWPVPTDAVPWAETRSYVVDDTVYFGRNKYTCTVAGTTGTVAPTHTTGTATDNSVTWTYTSTYDPLQNYARFRPFAQADYKVTILNTFSGSDFIVGDVVSLGNSVNAGPKADTNNKIAEVSGLDSVKTIRVTVNLNKDIIRTNEANTDLIYCSALSRHNFTVGNILFVEGFTTDQFNGSFFVKEIFSSRDFTYRMRATADADPQFEQGSIARVKIASKHPTLLLVRNHSYIFDMSDASNFGYFLSFAQDNQFKLEYSFNVIEREGTPGLSSATETPLVKFTIGGEVTNITYYFDPSRTGSTSPVGENSFIDVIKTPFDGRFTITEVISDTEFRFPLLNEPEFTNANIGDDEFDNPNTIYSTTSVKAIGPINAIRLISPGGFYKKLPIISDIASDRKIEKLRITASGTEYAPGVYTQIPILGDGEGGLCNITVENDPETGSGAISDVALTDPGKGYTTGSIDIDGIPGILGATLAGSGGAIEVVIPDEGSGAAVFLTGTQIGKIKTLKNNEFGYGYSHDYTLRPEIAFPINLQLFNTSILSQIKITNPGAGYTSAPAVLISGGGGVNAEAEAVVKNNRLSEILIKNPGSGYSSQPSVTLKSEFTYVVNLDLNYLQFNFPHGITTGAEIQFRADAIGSQVGILPKPSSVGLTSLSSAQTYYAIAGDANGLESDQLRFGLTPVDAESGNFITFLTQGDGRQVLLTEVFGGQAEAVVETSRFLEGEQVFQGETFEDATAFGIVSTNSGWQIEPKILKVTNPSGDFAVGGKVQGVISRASGVIDNLNIAKGVLNIDAITKTAGKFTDDVGKPSEIVQKIQDSFFYQNFSYVIKSQIPINRWKNQILENNHPVGFSMFGQLELTGGKDISGRKVAADFTKQVNINEYTNVNEITSFGAAEPIYSTFNNSEVLFRNKRLTNSEEILTSIVKKIDSISSQFDGVTKAFPIRVEGEQVIANQNQLLVTLNGVIQAPGDAYNVVGGSIVFSEAPRPDSKIVYRNIGFDIMPITRFNLNTIAGIFPSIGDTVNGFTSQATGKVVATGATSIDVVDISGGLFELNERVDVGRTGFSALIGSLDKSFTKLFLQNIGGTFNTVLIGDIVTGQTTGARATVTSIDLTEQSIQVTDMSNGYFDRGEDITFFTAGYGANILNVDSVNYKTIFEFGESVTSLNNDTAIIEESNLDLDGNISDKIVLSKTSGTAEFETGSYNLLLNDVFYSASSNIAARITAISPYRDPITSINVERPSTVTAEWPSFVEGDLIVGQTSGARGEVVRIDYEASPPILYYLKKTEQNFNLDPLNIDPTDGDQLSVNETVQRYSLDPNGDTVLDSLTETLLGEARIGGVVDTLTINKGSTFFGMIFERLISLTNANVILDDISKTTITPAEILDSSDRINADFLDFEEVRSTEIEYEGLTGGTLAVNDELRSIQVTYGNPVTDSLNRWKDAGRMIGFNRQEIIDFANAEIAVEHPGFYYPGDNVTDQFSRYADSYRLITKNKEYIIAKSYADMVTEYPSLVIPSATKCKRDIGKFIEALSMDMFQGGTIYTRKLLQSYFSTDGLTFLYIDGEEAATEYAFEQALGYMKNALSNMLTGSEVVDGVTYVKYDERSTGGSGGTGITADPSPGNPYGTAGSNSDNYGANNCSDVQSALQTLFTNVSEVLLATSLSDLIDLSEANTYSNNETKCRRDIGLLVDALAADIDGDGNYQTVKFIKSYFDNAGTPISNGLVGETAESVTAFRKAGEMCRKAINNLLYVQVNTRTAATGYMLKDPTTYAGPYLGSSGSDLVEFDVSAAAYVASTGVMTMTIGTHSLTTSDSIKIRPYSLRFTCSDDGNASFHDYPRTGDPAFNTLLTINAVTATTIEVNVGASPAGQQYAHTFISAIDNAVFQGGGGAAAYYDPNYYSGRNESIQHCADVQAGIHTLVELASTAITAGTLTNVNALAVVSDGSYQVNENIRVFKISYKDPGGNGLFIPGDTVLGATSGASMPVKGSNSGLKWLYTTAVTGTFQDREYITNTKLTATNAVLTGLIKKSGTKSLRFDAGGYLSHELSNVAKFETGDFTMEMWIRPTTLSGLQYLWDTRTSGAAEVGSPVLYLNGSNINWYLNGSDQISGAHNMGTNAWHHVAISRTTNITKLWVNGTQVGGDFTDNTNYLERAFKLGADLTGANGFVGWFDNIIFKKGVSDYTATFTPGSTYPTSTNNITFGMSMELPLIISDQERFGIYTGQTNSSTTAKSIDYDEKQMIIEDIDLGRDEYRKCAEIIELNYDWISEVAIGLMKERYSDFLIPGDSVDGLGVQQGTNKCLRDTKEYILKAIVEDIKYGGNYNSVVAGRGYLTKEGGLNYVGNELLQSIYTWTEVANVVNYVITTTSGDLENYNGTKYTQRLRIPNNFASPASSAITDEISSLSNIIADIIGPTGDRFRDAGDLIWKNRDYIAEETVGYLQATYIKEINGTTYDYLTMPGYGDSYCERDIKQHILPAVITDLITGGNSATQYVIDQYINANDQIIHIENELGPMLDAFAFINKLVHHAVNNTLLTSGTTAAQFSIPNQYQDDYYAAQYTQIAAFRDSTVTIDPKGYDGTTDISTVNKNLDAANLIEANKHVIATEAVYTMNDMSKYLDLAVPGGAQNCIDDVLDILDAVVHDLRFGGNSKVWDAAALYLNEEDSSLKHIEGEVDASLDVMKIAAEICILTMRNGFGRDNLYIYQEDGGVDPVTGDPISGGSSLDGVDLSTYERNGADDRFIDAANVIDRNIRLIAEEAVAQGLAQYPSLSINGVGAGGVKLTPTAATYNQANGDMTLTVVGHNLTTANRVTIKPNSIVFTCTQNSNATEHSYPRQGDPAFNTSLAISASTTDTFTVNVGAAAAEYQFAHTFVSAQQDAVVTNGSIDCVHDVTDVLSSMVWNLKYGGNNKVFKSAELYVSGSNLQHIVGVSTESIWILNKARDLAIQAMRDETITITAGHGFSQKTYTDLDYAPYSDGGYAITVDTDSPKCADVASAISTMMTIVTDTITTPASIGDGTITKTMPNIWPVKYAPEFVKRDVTITYDGGDWNQTCNDQVTNIETLFDILIDTISTANAGNPSYLAGLTRTTGYNSNTVYQYYTCYNVTSAADTLFELMSESLGGGSHSDKAAARRILFNKHAVSLKAFSETQTAYPATLAEQTFGDALIDGLLYDLNTGGNIGILRLVNTWFDGEGNFIAFPDVTKQHLLWYVTRISEYAKRILDDYTDVLVGGEWYGYDIYQDETHINTGAIDNRFEYERESTQFKIDSSLNAAYFAISRGTPPAQNSVQWTNNVHVVNQQNLYDEGNDWNTDPDLIINTPTVEVGFERRENRIIIQRPNFYSRGDVLQYAVASGDVESAFSRQEYFYVLNATPTQFEITSEIRHDARASRFALDTRTSGTQQLQSPVRSGITRQVTTYGTRDIDNPITGGFSLADVIAGTSSNATSEIVRTRNNEAEIVKLYYRYPISLATGRFTVGERVQVQGAGANFGTVLQTSVLTGDNTDEGWVYIEGITGTMSDGQVIEGVDSALTAELESDGTTRMLINIDRGAFANGEIIFNKSNGAEATIASFENSAGILTGNTGGRITIDIETLQDDFTDGDIIYGSITDKILDIGKISKEGFRDIELNQFVHATKTIECDVASVLRDQGFDGDFKKGDIVYLLSGSVPKIPGWTALVTDYLYEEGVQHKIWIANLTPYGAAADGTTTTDPQELLGGGLGKFENLNNFPIISASITTVTETNYTSYGKVSGKSVSGDTGRLWLEDVNGDFPSNLTIISDYGWAAGVTQSKNLLGRCDRFFRGFDGTADTFNLTVNNGESYFPDPAGHLLAFVNGVLQPPGANFAYTAFSDQITFTEPPTIGSEFIGYYVGKLRQLDDISFEFDSLRSSFNLKYQGGFYSLTLTEGVSSNTILPENNIIVSLNGVIQEAGIGYQLVGSRIIFAEIPRAGSTFVAFSYIGSDADVIAATVVPPIEAGDILQIEGEADEREVALIESSNSLITFEYTGTVKGRGAAALATIKTGEITKAIITAPGDGYSSRPNVDIISSTGFDGRVRALMGLLRIDVKTSGLGYQQPIVDVQTVVEDDFIAPDGPSVNQGFDTYAGEGTDAQGNPIVITPGYIQIINQPVNVTVNQGQTASFTIGAQFINSSDNQIGTTSLNYQWQRKQYGETNWANITGSTSATYTSNSAEQADDGDEFRVAATAAGATPVYSNSVILTVQTGATVISNFNPTQIFQ